MTSEATALLRAVLKSNRYKLEPSRCSVIADWLDVSVPEFIARAYFASRLHASLSPADVLPDPMKVFSVASADTRAPCYGGDATSMDRQRVAEAQQDAKLFSVRVTYSFPVFDEKYSTAATVERYLVKNISAIGAERTGGVAATDTVKVFRKTIRIPGVGQNGGDWPDLKQVSDPDYSYTRHLNCWFHKTFHQPFVINSLAGLF